MMSAMIHSYTPRTMKKLYTLFFPLLLLAAMAGTPAYAQCPYNNNMFTALAAPTTIGSSVGNEICLFAGEGFRIMNVQAGSVYRISTCSSDAGFDTRLTVYPEGGGSPLAFNDDFCGLFARLDFTPTSNQNIDILLDQTGPGNTCTHNQNYCGYIIVTLISTTGDPEYCMPLYNSPVGGTSSGDFINGVSLGTIYNQNTGTQDGPSYTFYENMSTTLERNQEYTLTVTNNANFTERIAAWIDYNQDFEFTDNERIGQVVAFAGQARTITFTTPADALTGTTRMRVRMVNSIPFGEYVDPCGLAAFGETEDYLVEFTADPQTPSDGLSFATICELGRAIPDNTCPNNTEATIAVANLGNLGDTHSLESVALVINHPMAADLDIYLESPGGHRIELSTDNGGAGANYGAITDGTCEPTLFSVNAVTSITAGTAPFVGSYLPEGNLNFFNTEGINPNGVWKLVVCDDFAGHTGTIEYFGINFVQNTPDAPACPASYSIADGDTVPVNTSSITWAAADGATSYDVYFGTDASTLVSESQAETSYTLPALTPGATYKFLIVAKNGGGNTNCDTISFTVESEDILACPTSYSIADGGLVAYENVELSWSGATGVESYSLYFGTELNPDLLATGLTDTTYNFGNLLPSTSYVYGIVVRSAADSLLCDARTFTTEDEEPQLPVCPDTYSVADGAEVDGTDLTVSWSSASGATSYDVLMGTSIPLAVVATGITDTTFTFEDLLPGTTYIYGIVVNNGAGNVDCPNRTFVTLEEVLPTCPQTYSLSDEDEIGGTVTEITWSAGADATSYDVYFGEAPTAVLVSENQAETSYEFPAVTPGTDYVFYIVAKNANGSTACATFNFVGAEEPVLPGCATNLSPAEGAVDVPTLASISWEPGTGNPETYDVYFGEDPMSLNIVAQGTTATSWSPASNLNPATTYYYLIIPFNDNGFAAGCAITSFVTMPAAPAEGITMHTGTVSVCDTAFFDAGGALGNYGDNQSDTLTITPSSPNSRISVTFNSFKTSAGSVDALAIFNGSSADLLNLVDIITGTIDSPLTYTSSSVDGALTFVFISDDFEDAEGWEATVTCLENTAPDCAISYSPADNATNVPVFTNLSWEPAPGLPATYTVYFGTDPMNLNELVSGYAGTDFDLADDLDVDETYYWQVVPGNEIGSASNCPVNSFTTSDVAEILMTNGSISTCGGDFYDTGGSNGNYSDNEFLTFTITPSQPNSVLQAEFTSYEMSSQSFLEMDGLIIINGSDPLTGDVLWSPQSADAPGTIISTAADGALSFIFMSDASGNAAGWHAVLSCLSLDAAPACATNAAPATGATINSTSQMLTWEAGVGAASAGYRVMFGTDAQDLQEVADVTDAEYLVENLLEETTYYWQVIPYNANGSADACDVWSFTTEGPELPVCPDVRTPADGAVDIDASAVTFTWGPPSDNATTSYSLWVGTEPDAYVLVADELTDTTYFVDNLDVNTNYSWVIVVSNENGQITCDTLSFTTAGDSNDILMSTGTVTTCAANFYDSGGADGNYGVDENHVLTICPDEPNRAIQVTFDSFEAEEFFFDPLDPFDYLEVYNGIGTNSAAYISPNTGGTRFSGEFLPGPFTSTSADGCLTFAFFSDESETMAGWSATVNCVPNDVSPDCAINFSPADGAVDQAANTVLSWGAGEGLPTGYDVYIGTSPETMALVAVNQPETTFAPQLTANETFYWTVVPRNGFGSASACDTLSFTTTDRLDILMHTGAITTCNANFYDSGALDGSYGNNEDDTLTICPSIPGQAIEVVFNTFEIEGRPAQPSMPWDYLEIYSGADTDGTPFISDLSGNSKFSGDVVPGPFTSTSADGCLTFVFHSDESFPLAGWSATISCVDPNQVPGCASNLSPADQATDVSATFTTLSWSAGSGVVTSYSVYFGTDPDNLALLTDGELATSIAAGQLQTSTTYYWQVVPTNNNGPAEACPVNSFTTSSSEDILMTDGLVTTCDANFFDAGGPSGNYPTDVDQVLTICPDDANSIIQVTFNEFDLEGNFFDPADPWDYLVVHNGNSVQSPSFSNPFVGGDRFSDTDILGTFTSSSNDGCLTFHFVSDDLFAYPGWSASVKCLRTDIEPACVVYTNAPADGDTAVCRNVSIAWSAGSGAVTTGYDVYFDSGNGLELVSSNQQGTSYAPAFLDSNTTYSYVVIARNDVGTAIGCDTITFTTGTCVEYCEATFSDPTCFEYISKVTIGEIDNVSACPPAGGYSDYTNLSANVYIGTQIPISIENGDPYASDSAAVWVDWNRDGDFDDADEAIVLAGQPAGPYTAFIAAPAGTTPGPVRMRIRVTDTDYDELNSCGVLNYGETEDYTLIVNDAIACPFPNAIKVEETGTTTATISWDPVADATQYLVRYRKVGSADTVPTWAQPSVVDAPVAITLLGDLESCADYIVQVATACDGEQPLFSFSLNFGTHCFECPSNATAELEQCGQNTNGGCLNNPPAFQTISCGETICGTTTFDGTTRDTDWYQFQVTSSAVYTVNLKAEFDGQMFILDVSDCDNAFIIAQGPDFTANEPYTLASTLPQGSYAIFVGASFDGGVLNCTSRNRYTVSLSSGSTQIAPVADVCETTPAFNLVATPQGGTWSGTGIVDTAAGTFDPSVSGVGSFTIVYNASNNGCAGSDTIVINVTGGTAAPPAMPQGDAALCSDLPTSVYTVASVPGVTNYIWSLTPSTAGTIVSNDTSAVVTWANGFTGTASLVVAAQSACGVSSFSPSLDIEVSSMPLVSAIQGSATSCGASTANYFVTDIGSSTSTTWTVSPQNAATLTPSGNSVEVAWAADFSGEAIISVTGSNACGTSNASTITVQVVNAPFVDFVGLAATYCSSDQPAVLTGIPAGGYFVINTTGSVGITGNVFDPSQVEPGVYNITYFNSIGECMGSRVQQVEVISGPAVTITPVQDMCAGDSAITLTASPANGSFSGPGVTGSVFNPAAVTPGRITITYTVTDPQASCVGAASTSFNVNPAPVVTIGGVPSNLCVGSAPVTLVGSPAPGTFSGPGVSGSTFDPATAGIGSHVITYEVFNGSCTGSTQTTIVVTTGGTVEFTLPSSVCTDDVAIRLTSNPADAVFSGPGVSNGFFNPAIAGPGTHTITAAVGSGACAAVSSRSITVNRAPIAGFNYGVNGSTVIISNTSLYADSYTWDFGDGNTSTQTNPRHEYAENRLYTIRLIAVNETCGSDTFALNVEISVGIGEIEGVEAVSMYPNPTSGQVFLKFNSITTQSFDIRVTDATGRIVHSEAVRSFAGAFNRMYDLSDKAKGVYFFTLTSEKGSMTFRIIRD